MHYFCTYFDSNFLYRGLALYKSLRENAGDFVLWILCFDDVTFKLLNALNLPGIRTICLADFETACPSLVEVKAGRSTIEYYFTTTPFLPLYILNNHPETDRLIYLDADLFFYDSVQSVYNEWSDGSVYIVPHRFHPDLRERGELVGGRYNVGLVGFRNDSTGHACLKRWGAQCLEWCFLRNEPGRLGDQKYLDEWPERYPGVVESKNIGIGVGGWNIWDYRIKMRGGRIFIEDRPLIMLHLNFVNLLGPHLFAACPKWYLRTVCYPYAVALGWAIGQVKREFPEFRPRYERLSALMWIRHAIKGGLIFIR
ncbi:MAG: glycosyl transferase [Verrucomicrobiota bacterium]